MQRAEQARGLLPSIKLRVAHNNQLAKWQYSDDFGLRRVKEHRHLENGVTKNCYPYLNRRRHAVRCLS